jgi:GNAT superfamily N-acetyltransferase
MRIKREPLDPGCYDWGRWIELFNAHAQELRGRDTSLDLPRYMQIQKEGRLCLTTLRNDEGELQGYASHFWHRHLHFNDRIAQDDAFYIAPAYRRHGNGLLMLEAQIEALRQDKVNYAMARRKVDHPHDAALKEIGFVPWELVHIKKL